MTPAVLLQETLATPFCGGGSGHDWPCTWWADVRIARTPHLQTAGIPGPMASSPPQRPRTVCAIRISARKWPPMSGTLPEEELDALRSVPMISALDGEGIRELLAVCRKLRRGRGARVFRAGEPAETFYVLLAGRVKVFQVSARGDEQVLHHLGPGATFGEAAVLRGGSYPASAEVLEEASLLEVGRSTLLGMITRNPELALGMLGGLSSKLQEFARLIEQLSLKEVPARLADVLLEVSRRAGSDTFRLDQTKRQLAAQIGTVAETLSRALKRLGKEGLIRVDGARITILDAPGLRDLAENG